MKTNFIREEAGPQLDPALTQRLVAEQQAAQKSTPKDLYRQSTAYFGVLAQCILLFKVMSDVLVQQKMFDKNEVAKIQKKVVTIEAVCTMLLGVSSDSVKEMLRFIDESFDPEDAASFTSEEFIEFGPQLHIDSPDGIIPITHYCNRVIEIASEGLCMCEDCRSKRARGNEVERF